MDRQASFLANLRPFNTADHSPVALRVTVTAEPEARLLADWCALVTAAQHETRPGAGTLVDISAVRQVRSGYEPLYVFIHDGAELLGGVRLLRRHVPRVGWVAYLPDIPIIVDGLGPRRAMVLRRLTQGLLALERQYAGLFLEPPDDAGSS